MRGLNLLTPREHEVLRLVAKGLPNAAIATRLSVSECTVETHTAQIFAKLGLDLSSGIHRRVLAKLSYLRAVG